MFNAGNIAVDAIFKKIRFSCFLVVIALVLMTLYQQTPTLPSLFSLIERLYINLIWTKKSGLQA